MHLVVWQIVITLFVKNLLLPIRYLLRLYSMLVLVLLVLVLGISIPVLAESTPYVFRIGTGGSAGTYYPIGALIAEAISDRKGYSRAEAYAVPGLLALAQRANGSVANVKEINQGLLEAGLAQADIAYWAYHGSGPFSTKGAMPTLRAVATLYRESLHLVARRDSHIRSVNDLKGHRVSLDEPGSGTLTDMHLILQAFGLSTSDIKPVYLKPTDAITRLSDDALDAFFIIAGYPVPVVAELIASGDATLVPIDGPAVENLLRDSIFFTRDTIPANTYSQLGAIPTVAVGSQLIVRADLDTELVYRITGLLWSAETKRLLTQGHPKGRQIRLDSALDGIAIPLHPGAKRYYQEIDMLAATNSR